MRLRPRFITCGKVAVRRMGLPALEPKKSSEGYLFTSIVAVVDHHLSVRECRACRCTGWYLASLTSCCCSSYPDQSGDEARRGCRPFLCSPGPIYRRGRVARLIERAALNCALSIRIYYAGSAGAGRSTTAGVRIIVEALSSKRLYHAKWCTSLRRPYFIRVDNACSGCARSLPT